MRKASMIFKTLIWIALIIYAFIQMGAIAGILIQNADIINNTGDGTYFNAVPLICAITTMLIAVFLFMALKKHRYIGLILAVVAAVLMLVVALDLGRVFAPKSTSSDTGLTAAKLIFYHIGIAVIPLMMLPAWLCERKAIKEEQAAKAMLEKSTFHFEDEKVFTDVDENGRETDYTQTSHPMKRSVRKRIKNSN